MLGRDRDWPKAMHIRRCIRIPFVNRTLIVVRTAADGADLSKIELAYGEEGESLTSGHEEMAAWVRDEQDALWRELDEAIRRAVNGVWSIQAGYVARRIVEAARLVGPTHPDGVLWRLTGSGIYDTLLDVGEIEHEPLTPEYLRETEALMSEHGGSQEALRIQSAATIAAMTDPREARDIREGGN